MDLSIRGSGGAWGQQRNPPNRPGRQARPPPERNTDPYGPTQQVELDSALPEQQRAEIAGFQQAVQAAENAMAIITTARSALVKVAECLARLEREVQRALEAPIGQPQGGPDPPPIREVLCEVQGRIDRIAETTRFGTLHLLDGSLGAVGMATGEGLEFVSASPRARSSPPEGYSVHILSPASRAFARGRISGPLGGLARPVTWTIAVDGRRAEVEIPTTAAAPEVVRALNGAIYRHELEAALAVTAEGMLWMRHLRFGSGLWIALSNSEPGLLGPARGGVLRAANGLDVVGTINGEPAVGRGRILTGQAGNPYTDGLAVLFSDEPPPSPPGGEEEPESTSLPVMGQLVGRVILSQQPLVLRAGTGEQETIAIRLNSVRCGQLGRAAETLGGVRSLAGIRVDSPDDLRDARRVIAQACLDVEEMRAGMDELANSTLAETLSRLRIQAENLNALYTNIAAPPYARQIVRALRERMEIEAPVALMAQTRPLRGTIMRLLSSDPAQEVQLGR